MRRCLLGDLLAAADHLAALPEAARPAAMARLMDQAHAAHAYHRRFGRPHPLWGDGSLMARALADGAFPAVPRRDVVDLAALAVAAAALQDFRRRRQGWSGRAGCPMLA